MIDRPDQAGRLLEQLSAALPIPVRVRNRRLIMLPPGGWRSASSASLRQECPRAIP